MKKKARKVPKQKVIGTFNIDLLELPPNTMASTYANGHLLLQIQCTEEEAAAFITSLNNIFDIDKRLDKLDEMVKESNERKLQIKQQSEELHQKTKNYLKRWTS